MELYPVQKEVLNTLFCHGDNVPKAIAENIDRHSKSVSRSLKQLENKDMVERKNPYGVWTITEKGESAVVSGDTNTSGNK